MPSKVIFLDRDGTLNIDRGYVHKIAHWQWIKGALDALEKLQKAGYKLAIITNQSGIGHSLYTEDDMHKLHNFMEEELSVRGIHIDAIAYCPHQRDQDECDCRKPDIGMARQVEEVLGEIDYDNSWTVGDKEADMLFGKMAGTKTAIIRSRYWKEKELTDKPDAIVDSLLEATNIIVPI